MIYSSPPQLYNDSTTYFTRTKMVGKHVQAIQLFDIIRFLVYLKDRWLFDDNIIKLINKRFPDINMIIRKLNTAIGKNPKLTMATIITDSNEQQIYRHLSTFHFNGKTCKKWVY